MKIDWRREELEGVERGFAALLEGQRTLAITYFHSETNRSADKQVLAAFFHTVLAQDLQGDHVWLLLAEKAPTLPIHFSCLKLALLLDPHNATLWQTLISFCRSIPDIQVKDDFSRKIYALAPLGMPGALFFELHTLLTPKEELVLGEQRATSLRTSQERPAYIHGIQIRRFRDWAITTAGIESFIGSYEIYWRQVWKPHWEMHIKEKGGSLGSYEDFLQALTFARSFFPVPPGSDGEAAQAYLKRLPPKQGGWFENSRIHTALDGIRVRSKSEVIIANMLTMQHIPFTYEQRLDADDDTYRMPDFTVVWGGTTFYWEHLGMLENVGYLERCDERLQWYRDHGFASTLIITTEVGGLDSDSLLTVIHQIKNK